MQSVTIVRGSKGLQTEQEHRCTLKDYFSFIMGGENHISLKKKTNSCSRSQIQLVYLNLISFRDTLTTEVVDDGKVVIPRHKKGSGWHMGTVASSHCPQTCTGLISDSKLNIGMSGSLSFW